MKTHHAQSAQLEARIILDSCGIHRGADFHALHRSHLLKLEKVANEKNYQAPKNASGSRLRYFHELMQRRAK